MQLRFSQVILRCAGLLLAAGLQIWSSDWHVFFMQRLIISQAQFDAPTFWLATIDILLGVSSGFLIAVILVPKPTQAIPKIPGSVIALSIFLPTVGLAIKWGVATNAFHLPIRYFYLQATEWAIDSGLPALWLGFSIGVLVKQLQK